MFQEKGSVNNNLEAVISVQLVNQSKINCLLDTGFNGTLFLPRKFVEENDLIIGVREVLQAAEDQIFEVDTATAKFKWLGEEISVTIFVSEIDEPSIGVEMFTDTLLEIDYKNRTVKITK
jgi:clan AA aspartic protease